MSSYTEIQIRTRITTLEGGLAKIESGADFSDRGVRYRTPDELLKAIAYWQGLLRDLLGRPRQYRGVASKGLT